MMSRKIKIILLVVIVLTGVVFTSYRRELPDDKTSAPAQQKRKENFQQVMPPPIPQKLNFAGEEVPLENFDVIESLDRELIVNSYFHSQTIRFIKLSPRYFPIIEPILKKYNIPDDFKYLALAESGFDPRAVSPANAVGIWQLLAGTAKDYGLEVNNEVDERYHIEKSTEAACKYLLESYAKYNNWVTVAASYNVGRRGIDRQVERQKETHYYNLLLNEETSRYVFRILALKTILENPEDYGFYVSKNELYPELKYSIIQVNTPIPNLAVFAQDNGINYKVLKIMNPWLRDAFLNNPNKKTYEIKILKGKYRNY
jgi:membrane-bound lytic murein transglycosylase D